MSRLTEKYKLTLSGEELLAINFALVAVKSDSKEFDTLLKMIGRGDMDFMLDEYKKADLFLSIITKVLKAVDMRIL